MFQSNVIVNIIGKDLNLNNGAITKAIMNAAGNGIKQEFTNKAPNGANPGDIVVTSGGNMNCTAIYHSVMSSWEKSTSESVSYLSISK